MSSFKWALTEHIDLPVLYLPFMTVSNGGVKLTSKLEGSNPEGDAYSKGVNLRAVNLKVMLVVNLTGKVEQFQMGSH